MPSPTPSGRSFCSLPATCPSEKRQRRVARGLSESQTGCVIMLVRASSFQQPARKLSRHPFAYLTAAYLALDIPARWLARRDAYGRWGLLMFAGAVAIELVGVARARRDAPPIAPVRPKFAKVMLGLSWVAAVFFTIGDLSS